MKSSNEVNIISGDRDLTSRIEKLPGALTAAELAALLNMGKTAVYGMAATGRIPSLRIGAMVRFDPARIAKWLRDHEIGADQSTATMRRAA